ncbi:MAG: GNAT family N-acetyltransferase [Bacteroidaceae bacterium]
MNIIIKDKSEQLPDKTQLQQLFLSVDWSSGHYPDKLYEAMKNYETVYAAWSGEKLVGLLAAMDDGIMTAYIHYLLVSPDYQGKGIGRKLVEQAKEKYKDYLRIAPMAYNKECAFYERCGFTKREDETPMFITSLWT